MVSFQEEPCTVDEGFRAALLIHAMIEEVLAEQRIGEGDGPLKMRESFSDTTIDW